MRTGECLSLLPSTVNGAELGAQKWRYLLLLRYIINPPDLPENYNGCVTSFDFYHALNFNKGGLIMARQNDLRDRVADLAS